MTYRTKVNDAGESPSASSRRQDDKAMKDIISAHRCKKLAKEGIIREVAMDRYAFNPDLELEAL